MATGTGTRARVGLIRIFTSYCLVYALAQGCLFLLMSVLYVGGNTGTTVAAMALSAWYASRVSMAARKQGPGAGEMAGLAALSLLGSILVSLVLSGLYLGLSGGEELRWIQEAFQGIDKRELLLVALGFSLFYFLVLWFFYVVFMKIHFSAMQKK